MENIKTWLSGKTGGTIRHVLSGLGTILIAFGITDSESLTAGLANIESIIGAVTWLVAWVWSMVDKGKSVITGSSADEVSTDTTE